MAVDFPASREKVFARYPYLRSSYFERRMLFERRNGTPMPVLTGSALPFARASIAPKL
jgi:hypothetical protein